MRAWRRSRPWEQKAWLDGTASGTPVRLFGIIGRRGIGESETLGLELLAAAGGCARKAGQPEKVQSESNMADLG